MFCATGAAPILWHAIVAGVTTWSISSLAKAATASAAAKRGEPSHGFNTKLPMTSR
jgi:hypothetical protein